MKKIYCTLIILITLFLTGTKAQTLTWAKSMGGSINDRGLSVFVDAAGNVYTTGKFANTPDFDPGPGVFTITAQGSPWDIFVSKLDASGNFVWAKSFGGSQGGWGRAITVDASGNVYTAGYYYGTVDFDPGASAYTMTATGSTQDVFISKLDASGNFVWAKTIGGTGAEDVYSIVLDGTGNVFTTGYFQGTTDFDPGVAVNNFTSAGNDAFISKLTSSGAFVFAKKMGDGSSNGCVSSSLVLDPAGNIYTTGYFNGTADFDPSASVYTLTTSGQFDADIFVSKLDATGSFVWAKSMGSNPNADHGNSIAVDAAGNVYSTGSFYNTADFDPGAGTFTLSSPGGTDSYISKLDASGNFVWANRLGGSGSDEGYSIAVDAANNVFTTGYFSSTADFDPGTGTYNLISAGQIDIYISKLDASGNFISAVRMGGTGGDSGASLILDAPGSIYLTGYFNNNADFDPSASVFNLTSAGSEDIFVVKLNTTNVGLTNFLNQENYSVKIYPNPCNNTFTILKNSYSEGAGQAQIEIYDVLGEKVYEEKLINDKTEISLSKESAGVYFVYIYFENSSSIQKLILQK